MTEVTQQKILDLFFNNPMERFYIRQLGRDTSLNTKTIMHYLQKLTKEGLVKRIKKGKKYPYYEANRLSRLYRFKKSQYLLSKIIKSGLIEYLENKTKSRSIILFGSVQKGTYHNDSDIDLFIQAQSIRLNLSKFERKIGYKINILFETNLRKLSDGLLNNIINGITVCGNLEIK